LKYVGAPNSASLGTHLQTIACNSLVRFWTSTCLAAQSLAWRSRSPSAKWVPRKRAGRGPLGHSRVRRHFSDKMDSKQRYTPRSIEQNCRCTHYPKEHHMQCTLRSILLAFLVTVFISRGQSTPVEATCSRPLPTEAFFELKNGQKLCRLISGSTRSSVK
jgi:hypothetical protein